MHAPRRHTRRLLLPPGWVALGFLLLLGCQVLLAHRRRMLPKNVLQLNLPNLKSDKNKALFSTGDTVAQQFDFSYEGAEASVAAETDRRWHDFELVGSSADFFGLPAALASIRAIKADTSHAGGVRVHIQPEVAYEKLVLLLDSVNNLSLQGQWLDIRRQPAVFYAVTPRPLTLAERRYYKKNECQGMGMGVVMHTVEPPLRLIEQVENLREPARRPLLLLTVGSIGLLCSALVAQGLWANFSCRVPF